MKRLLLIVVCLLAAFYAAWPLISAWQIKSAIDENNPAALSRKVDFPAVRASLAPVVGAKVDEALKDIEKQAGGGAGAVFASQLKTTVAPKIVETVMASLVTPQNVIRLAREKGTLEERIERIISEQLGKSGGLSGLGGLFPSRPGSGGIGGGSPVRTITEPPAGQRSEPGKSEPVSFGLSNIKSFAFVGPLAFQVGVAKEASAIAPDVTAQMSFTDFDWKLTGVVPRL